MTGRLPDRWRAAAVGGGAVALAVALGPLDGPADARLADHMAQHLLIGVVAPALLALAAPVRFVLRHAAAPRRRAIGRLLHALRGLLHPVVAVGLACAATLAWHLPAVSDAVERHGALHALDHASLFWTGLLAWAALLGADPVPAAPGAVGLLAAGATWMLPMSFVGALYANASRILIPAYATAGDTLAGQREAGTVMLLGGALALLPILLVAAWRALWLQEERQRRRERAR